MRRSSSAPSTSRLDLQAVEPASGSKTLAGAVLASMRSDILELKLAPG